MSNAMPCLTFDPFPCEFNEVPSNTLMSYR